MRSKSPNRGVVTRREFIWKVARFGGAAAMGSMFALDLLGRDNGGRPKFEGQAPATRRTVIILGGGMAGMSAAYELGLLGYHCTILEARSRPGGRCWTVRGGTEETETRGEKQTCRFDEGHFLNAGPMRIAHHHASTLAYCREFNIPLVVFPNINEAAYIHRDGRPKLRFREVRNDWRGYTAELLAKSLKQEQLDSPLTAADRERIIEYLRDEGRLNADLVYSRGAAIPDQASDPDDSRGYLVNPGAGDQPGTPTQPLDLETLVKAGYARGLGLGRNFNQQPTMLTPVGGMDRIAYGFADKLGNVIRYRTEVREVRRSGEGVKIRYADTASDGSTRPDAEVREMTGDFCICALPPAIMSRIPSDFSKPAATALAMTHPATAGKIGIQFKRRFWEEDDGIYGGISLTNQPIAQIGYPFDQFGSAGKGVVMGYYHFGTSKQQLDVFPFAERERRALAQGAKVHPQYPAEFENSFSIAWYRIPNSEMAWADWASESDFASVQKVLGEPDGPFYFAGDWLSHINAWQAGAFVSSHRVCRQLHDRARAS